MSDKLEMITCPHKICGHQWEPRVKNPKRCPQCQNPIWRSPNPKRKVVTLQHNQMDANINLEPKVITLSVPTLTTPSEAAAPTPPITATSTEAVQPDVSGVEEEKLEPIYTRVEVVEPETAVQRLQREADERLHRLANE